VDRPQPYRTAFISSIVATASREFRLSSFLILLVDSVTFSSRSPTAPAQARASPNNGKGSSHSATFSPNGFKCLPSDALN